MRATFIACKTRRIAPSPRLMATTMFALAAHVAAAFAQESVSPAQQFQLALEAQTTGHYQEMLALLRSAGEAGHLPAQEMLGMTLLAGPSMYGDAVPADRCEAGHWIRRALGQGSIVARHQWMFLGPPRRAPQGAAPCDDPAE